MHNSVAYLFIVTQSGQDSLAVESRQGRQPSDRSNCRFNALLIRYREFFKRGADSGSRDHSITDSFAVFDPLVFRRRFQSMPDRVAEIENPAKIALSLVRHDDIRFD